MESLINLKKLAISYLKKEIVKGKSLKLWQLILELQGCENYKIFTHNRIIRSFKGDKSNVVSFSNIRIHSPEMKIFPPYTVWFPQRIFEKYEITSPSCGDWPKYLYAKLWILLPTAILSTSSSDPAACWHLSFGLVT